MAENSDKIAPDGKLNIGFKKMQQEDPERLHEIAQKGGHAGGTKVAQERGSEFYSEIGHKGGEKVAKERGPEFYREIGHKGGEARAAQMREDKELAQRGEEQ